MTSIANTTVNTAAAAKSSKEVVIDNATVVVPSAPTSAAVAVATEQESNKSIYEGKTAEEIFGLFGGEKARGAISGAMRAMSAAGYTTSKIASMLGKRYQHVRNVLNEPTQKAVPTPNCDVTLPVVSLLKKPEVKEEAHPSPKAEVKKEEPKAKTDKVTAKK